MYVPFGEICGQRAPQTEPRHELACDCRTGHHHRRGDEEAGPGLQRVVAQNLLEVNGQEVERGAEGRHEHERDADACDQVGVGEQPGWYERVVATPLDEDESSDQQ
jgi:hypothetical protein